MIDSHAHLISTDREKYPPAPLSGVLEESAFDDPVTAERLIQLLDEQRIDKALAVQRAHLYGFHNDYVVDSAQRYPDRLRALCMIDALADDVERTVKYWVGERGSVGIRLTEPKKGADCSWFASERAMRAWRAVSDLGGSVRLHFYRWNRVAALAALEPIVTQFPRTPIVLDHFSNIVCENPGPDYGVDDALLKFADSPNVYLLYSMINLGKLQAANLPAAPVVERVVRAFGADRVMWGSDIAQSKGAYSDMVRVAKDSVSSLSADDQQKVLHRAAERVYFS